MASEEILRGKKNTVRVVRRKLTDAEQKRLEASRAEVEANFDSYMEEGRKAKRQSILQRDTAAFLSEVMSVLRTERDRQGVSLADLTERTGIARSAISALENADEPNPTISTINRIAEALGVTVAVTLVPNGRK